MFTQHYEPIYTPTYQPHQSPDLSQRDINERDKPVDTSSMGQ